MDCQRLRNLTTGRLHTNMGDIEADLCWITGEKCLFTHMLPRAMQAVEWWLRDCVADPRFWDDQYDPTHVGEYYLPEPTQDDRKRMTELYFSLPNPLLQRS